MSIRLAGITLERAGRTIIRHAHLTVAPGELVIVTGARGAGKSLLLAAAAGVVQPTEGTVEVGGRTLGSLRTSLRMVVRRNIGYLPSDPPFLRDESTLDIVMLALAVRGFAPGEAEKVARRSLTDVGADAWAARPINDLSPGERRLVAIARALCGPPPLVILDEPTAGLDPGDLERLARTFAAARDAGAALLCASNDAGLLDAVAGTGSRTGARHVRLVGGVLVGAHGSLRVVEDDETPTAPADVIDGFERSAAAHAGQGAHDTRATSHDLPAHTAREVS